jgi:hypothetical protein
MIPRADASNFELAVNTKCFNTFYYRTGHSLKDVLSEGYFDSVFDCSPRKGDRVEVLASCGQVPEQHATVAVKEIVNTSRKKSVLVSLLSSTNRGL